MHPWCWVSIRMRLSFYPQVFLSFQLSISHFWHKFVDQRLLVLDLLSVHLDRNINGSTIISYHPTLNIPATTAKFLYERIRFAGIQPPGQNVYSQRMFQKSQDPTLILLTFMWHAVYAWDEALESLYKHICWLVSRVLLWLMGCILTCG